MKKKYFFKNQSSLQRKAIASSLAATFVFGTVGSGFAGAMIEQQMQNKIQDKKIDFKPDDLASKFCEGGTVLGYDKTKDKIHVDLINNSIEEINNILPFKTLDEYFKELIKVCKQKTK